MTDLDRLDAPRTATGRKVIAIHGTALLDDVLGIESEAPGAITKALEAMTAERDALQEDEDAAVRERDELRDAALLVMARYDRTHLQHDVAYEEVADAINALRAALHREGGACRFCHHDEHDEDFPCAVTSCTCRGRDRA